MRSANLSRGLSERGVVAISDGCSARIGRDRGLYWSGRPDRAAGSARRERRDAGDPVCGCRAVASRAPAASAHSAVHRAARRWRLRCWARRSSRRPSAGRITARSHAGDAECGLCPASGFRRGRDPGDRRGCPPRVSGQSSTHSSTRKKPFLRTGCFATGFLLGPALAQQVADLIETNQPPEFMDADHPERGAA